MKRLTIITEREIPDEHWEDYKLQAPFVDYDKLEKDGEFILTQSDSGETVKTIFKLSL